MDLRAALRHLDSHVNLEATAGRIEGLSLDRMRALVDVLGDPQKAYPVVHITGTNGKGSVSRMTSELLRAAELSVGTYTSPHLESVTERLVWDGSPIDPDTFAELISDIAMLEPLLDDPPSYFELVTAAALRWFADIPVDVAVVEVGLLGRFDATNVCDGQVAVLTNVGRDHTDGRGDWRRRIAEEKVGIVKPGSTFVLGETDLALAGVFASTPAAEILLRGRDFDVVDDQIALGGRVLTLRTPAHTVDEIFLPLHGPHQAANAALALASAEALVHNPLDADAIRAAFASVRVPGRFEVVRREPTVIVDGAHNVDGAAAAARTLAEEFTLSGGLVLVVGMLEGRDPVEVLEALGATEAGFLVACTPPSPRAIPAAQVAAAADSLGIVAESVPDVQDAVRRALAFASVEDLVLVTGSLYVVGAARSYLLRDADDDLNSAEFEEGDDADDVRSWEEHRRSAATAAGLSDLSDEIDFGDDDSDSEEAGWDR